MTVPQPASAPLRRRGDRMRQAVLASTVEVLSLNGLAGTTVGAVARTAGVHETSIYRRWKTRENLILDALTAEFDAALPVPDTGDVREDLVRFFSALARLLGTAQGESLLRLSVEHDEALEERRSSYWSEQLERAAVLVRRGVDRGEVAEDVDPVLLVEAICGPLFTRALLSGAPFGEDLVRDLVGLTLDGAASRESARLERRRG